MAEVSCFFLGLYQMWSIYMGLLDNLVNYTLRYWHSLSERLDIVVSSTNFHNYGVFTSKLFIINAKRLHPTRNNNHLLAWFFEID